MTLVRAAVSTATPVLCVVAPVLRAFSRTSTFFLFAGRGPVSTLASRSHGVSFRARSPEHFKNGGTLRIDFSSPCRWSGANPAGTHPSHWEVVRVTLLVREARLYPNIHCLALVAIIREMIHLPAGDRHWQIREFAQPQVSPRVAWGFQKFPEARRT